MTNDEAVKWMAKRGIISYQTMIQNIESDMDIMRAEGGRYSSECDVICRRISLMRKEIEEIKQAAYDRYTDWATD